MKHTTLKILALALVITGTISFFGFRKTAARNEQIVKAMMKSLKNNHYVEKDIDNEFSKHVFNLYIERLDYNKKFFLQSDIDELKKWDGEIDDELNYGTTQFYERSVEILNMRTKEAETYYKDVLSKPFDFKSNESIQLDPKKTQFAKNKEDLKEQWRLALKYQTLARLSDLIDEKETAAEKKDTSYHEKPFEQMEADARKSVLKNNDDYFKRLKAISADDHFSFYLNAVTSAYDPHSDYFTPPKKEEFDQQMSGKFEGIGAQLQEKDGYIKVTSIIVGSASWRQGKLKVDDVILKVAQGDKDPVDVKDMLLNDVVKMIRGKKGTEVRLTVKKPDGSIVVIAIIRDIVETEETFAKSLLIKTSKKNIGYIDLPEFYADFNTPGGRRSASDIKKEIEKLKKENAKGIILDLRNNGGGSLQDVIDMAGLFVDRGPMVQVKSRNESAYPYSDNDGGKTYYDGELIILVNEYSASASEIMAAAIQDYKRGIIIGSPTTFGKGTVQRVVDLGSSIEAGKDNPLGNLKVTFQKFYRINGSTTQLKGVVPDIILPDPYEYLEYGEKDEDYPLPFDKIDPAKYEECRQNYNAAKVIAESKARVGKNETFKLIEENAKRFKEKKDDQVYSLNLEKYRAEVKKERAENKKYEDVSAKNELNVSGLVADEAQVKMDQSRIAKRDEWYKVVKKDPYVNEAVNVMLDMLK